VLALKEWKKLDGAIQVQFKKALEKLVENPKIPSADDEVKGPILEGSLF